MSEPRLPRTKFSMVPNILFDADVSTGAFKVFACLVSYTSGNDVSYPSIRGMAKVCKLSHTTVCKAIEELEAAGLVVKHVSKSKHDEESGWTRANNVYDLSPAWEKNQTEASKIAKTEIEKGGGVFQILESAYVPDSGIRGVPNSGTEQYPSIPNKKNNNQPKARWAGFDDFWERLKTEYPKRDRSWPWSKALPKAIQVVKSKETADAILDGAIKYRKYLERTSKIGTPYISLPSTFLNDPELWNAEYSDSPTPHSAHPPSPPKKHYIKDFEGVTS